MRIRLFTQQSSLKGLSKTDLFLENRRLAGTCSGEFSIFVPLRIFFDTFLIIEKRETVKSDE